MQEDTAPEDTPGSSILAMQWTPRGRCTDCWVKEEKSIGTTLFFRYAPHFSRPEPNAVICPILTNPGNDTLLLSAIDCPLMQPQDF